MQPVSPVIIGSAGFLDETVFAKDQPEYQPLPAHVANTSDGMVTSRWKLTWRERLTVLWHGNIYLQLMMFKRPLTPSKLSVHPPKELVDEFNDVLDALDHDPHPFENE